MDKNQTKKIILLGGHDLEMLTIKQMLEGRDDCKILDEQLRWDNASLSAYQNDLSTYEGHDFYGIELKEDIPLPNNYHRIDHHNDKYNLQSSLEQIAEIFGIELNHQQLLVAANDKGYIPAMKSMGATDEEIEGIRLQDRQAQGVTEEDERLADQSIKENLTQYGSITIVKALTHKFSPICDKLYPYDKLLIYTNSEWTYYGTGKNQLVNIFEEDIKQGKIFHGGGNDGYIGTVTNAFSQEEMEKHIEKVKTMDIFSYHNFIFPFQWRIKEFDDKTFSEQINLNNIDYSLGSNWERIITPLDEKDKDDLYNEKNYFYEFVHDALYDNGQENSLIRHYERLEPKHGEVKYIIKRKRKSFELKVAAINLNIYSTGVGVLSFYLFNEKYPTPEDVLNINQYGRRIFPPHIKDVEYRGLIADSIEVQGLQGRETGYFEDFSRYTNKTSCNTPASFIKDMILEIATNIVLKPVIDDRMFMQCWYKNDEWTNEFKGDDYKNFINSNKWYEFVFVDSLGGLSCQNTEMQKKLIKEATYLRWQKSSSLYGISRYSMVYATNSTCPDFLLNNFETLYARMAELILVQKASVLRFSAEVTNISNMDSQKDFSKKVSSLYKEYIRFVNQIHFREVSAQDQGIELYQMFYKTMDIEKQVEKLDAEIEELYNYVTLQEDRKSNNTMSLLTWIATFLLPITVMAGIFGMNNVAFNGDTDGKLNEWWNSFWGQFATIGIITLIIILIILLIKRKKNG